MADPGELDVTCFDCRRNPTMPVAALLPRYAAETPFPEVWGLLMSMNYGFFVLLCAQLLEEVEGRIFSYAAASTLWRRRSNPARPYMDRLMTFNRLICPSTGPCCKGGVRAACTSRS